MQINDIRFDANGGMMRVAAALVAASSIMATGVAPLHAERVVAPVSALLSSDSPPYGKNVLPARLRSADASGTLAEAAATIWMGPTLHNGLSRPVTRPPEPELAVLRGAARLVGSSRLSRSLPADPAPWRATDNTQATRGDVDTWG